MTQVLSKALNQDRREFDLADDGVAASAKQSSNLAGRVIMVNNEIATVRSTQETSTILSDSHLLNLVNRESVLAHQPSAQVPRLGRAGVCSAPHAEPLIPAIAIHTTVFAVTDARTRPALSACSTPIGKRRVVQRAATQATGDHEPIVPRRTSTQVARRAKRSDAA